MEARFTNGCSVSRVWADGVSTELLAAFQYTHDAEKFAIAKLKEDAEHGLGPCIYVVADCHSGKISLARSVKT